MGTHTMLWKKDAPDVWHSWCSFHLDVEVMALQILIHVLHDRLYEQSNTHTLTPPKHTCTALHVKEFSEV